MNVRRFLTATDFLARVHPSLSKDEPANNFLLGNTLRLLKEPFRPAAVYMGTVETQSGLDLALLATPGHSVMLSIEPPGTPESLRMAAEDLFLADGQPNGVNGTLASGEIFSAAWQQLSGTNYSLFFRLGLYVLTCVQPPHGVPGRLRIAVEADRALLVEWAAGFAADTNAGSEVEARNVIENKLTTGDVVIWETPDGTPVSMAAQTRPLTRGIMVSFVYTPHEQRGHGYASACTAALSQRLLDSGWGYVALFTDLANPVSNAIYPRIGYQKVGEQAEFQFGE